MAKRKKSSQPSPSPLEVSLQRVQPLLNDREFILLLDELKQPLRSAIRLNPLKVEASVIDLWMKRYGWQVEPVPFCPAGYQVNRADVLPSQTLEHRMGMFYIQDAASMLPVELFSFEENSRPLILDLAASPGGKTTHLIANSDDQGFVLANDASRERIQALRIVLQNWGGVNSAICCFPGEQFGKWFAEVFDCVLLDAPCSMEGLRATEAHPLRPISERERLSLARRQQALLESALRAVKVGGQVVYSTCTLAPEEDERVLDHALRKYAGKIQIEPVALSRQIPPALTRYRGEQYLPEVARAIRLWPHQFHTAGFFAALIKKVDGMDDQSQPCPHRSLEEMGWELLTEEDRNRILAEFQISFGFDLQMILERYELSLWKKDFTLYLFPERYRRFFDGLPVQSLGMVLGEEITGGILPAHEFCSRFFSAFRSSILTVPEVEATRWLQGSDLPYDSNVGKIGGAMLLADEQRRFIGVGKIQRERIKNLLPRRLIQNRL